MKKTVVIDLGYMKPSVGGSRSRSRSRKRIMNVNENDDDDESIDATTSSEELNDYDYDYDDDDDDDEYDIVEDKSSTTVGSNIHPSVKDSDYAVDSDEDLLQSVLDEPTFPLDINAILSAMNKTENNTIANLTLKKIHMRRHEILSSLHLTPEKMSEFERKLQMYRVIENPYDLKHNQLIRWIPLRSLETRPYLTLGGILFNVRENLEEEGIHNVSIRNVKRFVFNIKFELNIVFQRLSEEELLILRAIEYVDNEDNI